MMSIGIKNFSQSHLFILILFVLFQKGWMFKAGEYYRRNIEIGLEIKEAVLLRGYDYGLTWTYEENVKFAIPQCHAQQANFTMISMNTPEVGSDLGVVVNERYHPLAIKNTAGVTNLTVYCVIVPYTYAGPIPGACNEEFMFELDPNIRLWYDGIHIWLQYQYAGNIADDKNCDDRQEWHQLEYSLYALLFDDGPKNMAELYSSTLSSFLSADDFKRRGVLLHTAFRTAAKPALVVTSYPNQAVMFGIVVRNIETGLEAAYVPGITYGCDIRSDSKDCQIQWWFYAIGTFFAVLGIFLTLFGHESFKAGLFVTGFLAFTVICVMVCLILKTSVTLWIPVAFLSGIVGGFLWLLVWWSLGFAPLSVLLIALEAGFLLTSIVFYTPIVNYELFHSNWTYWLIYGAGMILMALLTAIFSKTMNILCYCFVGSYAIAAAVSMYVNGTLEHIIIEPFRRASVSDYSTTLFAAPFLAKDIILTVCWFALMVIGCIVQFYRNKDKPDFPESPRRRRALASYTDARPQSHNEEQDRLITPSNSFEPPPSYGSVADNAKVQPHYDNTQPHYGPVD